MSTPDPEQAPRLFQCSSCSRSFTRADHLTRHVRAHTRQKPYVCPICSKGFARVDLLKRHASNHESDRGNNSRKREIVRASRVIQACEACSHHHLRCEDSKPCSRCRKKKIPCRAPTEGNAEIDAIHAAQDLLELSNNSEALWPDTDGQHGHSDSIDPAPEEPLISPVPVLLSPLHAGATESEALLQPISSMDSILDPIMQPSLTTSEGQDALDDDLPEFLRSMPPLETCLSGQVTPRGIMDLSFNWDLSLNDLDIAFLDQYNLNIPFNVVTPSTEHQEAAPANSTHPHEGVEVRHEAFKRSVWRYLPRSDRDFGAAEEPNLAIADSEVQAANRSHLVSRRAIQEKLDRVTRDKIFALVLGTCNPLNIGRIAAAFPSTELLDGLIQYFLTSPTIEAERWLHLPTLSPSKLRPELLALMIAAGAVSTPDVSLRKLGFALHEAGRIGQAKAFESDNTSIRDLHSLQNLMLQLEIGLWSGMSRKMEIAESFLQPLVTMIRRGGRFRASMWKDVVPSFEDDDAQLEDKWKQWVDQESYLRLVYRTFEHDRQSSMALLKPPLISYSEMQLPLPCPESLWHATTSTDWRETFVSTPSFSTRLFPADCLSNLSCLHHHRGGANLTFLYLVWGMIWEYRQMAALASKTPLQANNNLILSSRRQELAKSLDDFRVSNPANDNSIVLELVNINLNAPMEDVQIFAGIEGQEEARRVYPSLKEWVGTSSARQSLWHAGQILRIARNLPKARLCNFNAIALYHAGLILWGYGFIKRTTSVSLDPAIDSSNPTYLDGDHNIDVRRFIALDRGFGALRPLEAQAAPILVSNVARVLDNLVHLFRANHDIAEGACPPLVENLVQLIQGLQNASK